MTIKYLEKLTEQDEPAAQQQQDNPKLELLKSKLYSLKTKGYDKPFYVWFENQHRKRYESSKGQCCFVDVVGRMQKDGKDMPLLPWQKLFWNMLHERRRIVLRKARGIGLSTLMLYIIAYKCLTEFKPGDRVAIISGVRQSTVSDLIRRLKLVFLRNFPGIYSELAKQKDSIAIINGIIVEGYPVHTDTIRGIDRLKLAWIDEADMFVQDSESENVRSVIEGFLLKANSKDMYVVWSSTPRVYNGLLWQLEHDDPSIYYSMALDYRHGLEGPSPIYNIDQLDEARKTPKWSQEYECSYESSSKSCFSHESIDRAIELGKKYPDTINQEAEHSLGIDPGFGSSQCAFVCLEYSDSIIKVVYAKQYEHSSFNDMVQEVWNIRNLVGGEESLCNVYIDQANTEFIEAVKQDFNEDSDWQYVHDTMLEYGPRVNTIMKVVPVSFSKEGPSMLTHVKNLLEFENGIVAINPKYTELIAALKGAQSLDNYKLDKTESPNNDLTDAFRLAAKYFKLEH